jgi:hypothetical protein
MSDGFPWRIIGICLIYIVIAKLWRPRVKGLDLSPYLLVQNGFAFGVHGAGLVLCYVLSNGGRDGFDCSPLKPIPFTGELTFDYIKSESVVHLTIVFLMLRIFMLSESLVLMLMSGKPPSNWRIANEIALLIFTFIGVKYLPGGPALFFGKTYLAFYTFTYGYYTLKLGYSESHEVLRKSRKYFIYMKFIWSVVTLGHHLFLAYAPQCQKNPILFPLSFTEFIYAFGTFFSAISDQKKLNKKLEEERKKQPEADQLNFKKDS